MEIYKAKFEITKDESVDAAKQYRKSNLGKKTELVVNTFALLIGLLALFIIFKAGLTSLIGLNCLLILAVALAWFGRHRIEDLIVGSRHAKRKKEINFVEWEFSAEDLKISYDDLVSVTMKWKLIDEIAETETGFIVYTQKPQHAYWLPFSAFETREGIYHFKRLADANDIKIETKKE